MVLAVSSHAFSQLSVLEILTKTSDNGITAIEWCDCHLPIGEIATAERLRLLMEKDGMHTLSYRVSQTYEVMSDEAFDQILQTAKALGTNCITLFYDKDQFPKKELSAEPALIQAAQHMADMAKACGMTLCFASKGQSLFRDYLAVTEFMKTLNRENVSIHWQPNGVSSLIYNLFELKMLSPFIRSAYVALCDSPEEQPLLIEGQDEWQQYLKVLGSVNAKYILLQNPRIEEFSSDCRMMQDWMEKVAVTE